MKTYLQHYLANRPLFLSLIRAKEAILWQKYKPFSAPVLDLGCGDGFFAHIVFGSITIGLDVEDSRISESKQYHDVYEKIVTYDGHAIPFAKEAFDTIVSNCVMEHIPNIDEVVLESFRVLKPGGTLFTTVMARPWEKNLFGALLFGHTYQAWMKKKQVHFNLFTYTEWKNLFERAGFQVRECIGYLTPTTCKLIDVCHYLSLPSLITKTFFGKWVMWPTWVYPISWLSKQIAPNTDVESSGALFFVLKKPQTLTTKSSRKAKRRSTPNTRGK